MDTCSRTSCLLHFTLTVFIKVFAVVVASETEHPQVGNVEVVSMSLVNSKDGSKLWSIDVKTDVKAEPFDMEENTEYKIEITFMVHRHIVSGLRYHEVTEKKGIRFETKSYMIGSYGPKKELHRYTSPPQEAPAGMIARGTYDVYSTVLDDDKNVIKEWTWKYSVTKKWEKK